MVRANAFILAILLAPMLPASGSAATPPEQFLRNLPAGVTLSRSNLASREQVAALGNQLGGRIERISNSHLQVHGRPIQVNAVTAADDAGAAAILATLNKTKPFPYCFRRQRMVIEYVGRDVDEALATKTSYELGLMDKPDEVRYRVVAQLALVDEGDYMAANPLFQQFLALEAGKQESKAQIAALASKMTFGKLLALRNPRLGTMPATFEFEPSPSREVEQGATVAYSFEQVPEREGVPYVTVRMEVSTNKTGFYEDAAAQADSLTAATPRWPVDNPQVRSLARQITAGKTSDGAKVMAILEWLTPGRNIRYDGQTGSRYGTAQVFEQRFGHCWDFADCFVTLARAADVPCRQVAGWLYGSSGHVWAEFHRTGKGWQQVDPTGGGELRCGIYHVPYFTSEDGEMPIVYVAMPTINVVHPPSAP